LVYRGSGSTSRHNAESLKIEMSEYEKRLNSKTENFGNEANREKIKRITDSAGISMSEIASCSYEAREVGVKNGMFMGSALRLCPDLQTIPYEFERFVF
jgi:DNA repair protein REV1